MANKARVDKEIVSLKTLRGQRFAACGRLGSAEKAEQNALALENEAHAALCEADTRRRAAENDIVAAEEQIKARKRTRETRALAAQKCRDEHAVICQAILAHPEYKAPKRRKTDVTPAKSTDDVVVDLTTDAQ
jgi:hypothetical protein